jgi:hypothetical protein
VQALFNRGKGVRTTPPSTRLERTHHERAFLLSCVGEPLKHNVRLSVGLARMEKVYPFRRLPNDILDLFGNLA